MILDEIDLKLLAELEINSRQSYSALASKLNISRQLTRYRIKNLLSKNIIKNFYTIINFTMLGYTHYRTMIRLSNTSSKIQENIIFCLINHPNVEWLVECGGRWDLIVNFMARNIIQYFQFMRHLQDSFPQQIKNYDILTTVEILDLGRDYLSKTSRRKKDLNWFGREYRLAKCDETDLQILNVISENARLKYKEIAQKVGIHTNTLIKKIKRMEKINLILGYKPLIDLRKTPFSAYKALIKFQNITERKKDEITNFLRTNENIVAIIKLIGQWDMEVEFEVESNEKKVEIIRKIRDKYQEVINMFEVIPLFKEYRYNFFPKDLLSEEDFARN